MSMGNEIGTTAGNNNVIRQAYPFEGGVNIVKVVKGNGNPEAILKKMPKTDEITKNADKRAGTDRAEAKNTDKGDAATKKKHAETTVENGKEITYPHDNGITHIDLIV